MSTRSLTVTWQDPNAAAAERAGLDGLTYLRRILEGKYPQAPIASLLGFHLVEIADGLAVWECTPGEQHYNPIGVVHGGLACTLLDSAMGCAVNSTLKAGTGYTTLELKINLVRAITVDTGPMRCEGRIVHRGRQTATAEGRLLDAAGKLYAHATTTCMIFNAQPA
jgi:uncharacterized protein (TIGR00369 family)